MMKTAPAERAIRLLLGTAALVAMTHGAAAQPFFRAWGGYYAAPPPYYYDDDYDGGPYPYGRPAPYGRPGPSYVPGSGGFARLDAEDIASRAAAAGYRLAAPPRSAGRTFVAVGEDRNGRRHRLVFDAGDGRLIGDRLVDENRRTGAVAPSKPPVADKRAPAATPAKAEPDAIQPPASSNAGPAAPAPVAPTPPASMRVRVDKDPLAIPRAPAEPANPPTPVQTSRPAAAPAASATRDAPAAEAGRSDDAPAAVAAPQPDGK